MSARLGPLLGHADLLDIAEKAGHSTLGPDGVPYLAYALFDGFGASGFHWRRRVTSLAPQWRGKSPAVCAASKRGEAAARRAASLARRSVARPAVSAQRAFA